MHTRYAKMDDDFAFANSEMDWFKGNLEYYNESLNKIVP